MNMPGFTADRSLGKSIPFDYGKPSTESESGCITISVGADKQF